MFESRHDIEENNTLQETTVMFHPKGDVESQFSESKEEHQAKQTKVELDWVAQKYQKLKASLQIQVLNLDQEHEAEAKQPAVQETSMFQSKHDTEDAFFEENAMIFKVLEEEFSGIPGGEQHQELSSALYRHNERITSRCSFLIWACFVANVTLVGISCQSAFAQIWNATVNKEWRIRPMVLPMIGIAAGTIGLVVVGRIYLKQQQSTANNEPVMTNSCRFRLAVLCTVCFYVAHIVVGMVIFDKSGYNEYFDNSGYNEYYGRASVCFASIVAILGLVFHVLLFQALLCNREVSHKQSVGFSLKQPVGLDDDCSIDSDASYEFYSASAGVSLDGDKEEAKNNEDDDDDIFGFSS